ncbi:MULTISPECIES: DNA internalization-related competence protein ComEC/Rec2 [Bacillus]|uniref:Competence protein ComE n=2 Tax=Bacillus TaxID=1386 RepID=A0A0M5JEI9_9BACI|nr:MULTISPECIES: DNA internalization-related competence protein ComEC/Rec2 [Bacillus]ALC81689.1 competence protein ComE [Bacillus gobiensis]MBP1080741.1 competence protein ComEC [Bacillus capparidis]MED1094596.1 DNA internalization-related competence protein ComEC/Rec2 [Bacillus capparidis]
MSLRFFLLAISSAAGIAIASSSNLFFLPVIICLFIYCLYQRRIELFFLCLFFIFLFFFNFKLIDHINITRFEEGSLRTEASLIDIPKLDGDRFSANVKTREGEIFSAVYYLNEPSEISKLSQLEPGNVCVMNGELKPPKNATVPGTFNYKQYLHDKKIHWIYRVNSIEDCRMTGNFPLKKIRKAGLDFIKEHVPETSAGIVQALIFGDQQNIDPEVIDAYQQLGIIHILAISGLHVGILTAALYHVLLRLGMTRESAKLLLIAVLPLYSIITGASPSVLRAAFMTMAFLLFSLINVRLKTADALCLVFLGLLLIDPYQLFQVGFQLSFAVTFFLLMSKSIIQQIASRIGQLIMVSLIAQLGSLPILLYHFQSVSLLGLVMNILFVPFYTLLILPFALINFILMLAFPSLGAFFFRFLDFLMQWSHQIAVTMAAIDPVQIITVKPGLFQLLFYVMSAVLLLYKLETSGPGKASFVSSLLLVAAVVLHLLTPSFLAKGEVVMLDIGQGDSMFISAPRSKGNVLVDTGGIVSFPKEEWRKRKSQFSIGKNILIPFLTAKGIRQLDALVLTHADQDHIGEADVLITQKKVKKLIVPIGFIRERSDESLITQAMENGIPVEVVQSGDVLEINDLTFRVLAPEEIDKESKNNSSLVLWFRANDISWLLTGDLEKEGELSLLKKYPSLMADILKVGHHGSKGSSGSEFIKQLHPKAAFISVGENNRYQHPHQEVLNILSDFQVHTYRTDKHGSIQYVYDNKKGTIQLHPPYDTVPKSK